MHKRTNCQRERESHTISLSTIANREKLASYSIPLPLLLSDKVVSVNRNEWSSVHNLSNNNIVV